jgi:hypothetical protein
MPPDDQGKPKRRLTAQQRRLRDEIHALAELVGVDPSYIIENSGDTETLTFALKSAKDCLIRGEIVFKYTLITTFIDWLISTYYFGPRAMELWRTKKFQNFNYYILEPLSLIKKVDLLSDVLDVPKNIRQNIHDINDLRNALAHAFLPEYLRRYRSKGVHEPTYKGQSIRSLEALERFQADVEEISEWYFSCRNKGFRKRRARSGS